MNQTTREIIKQPTIFSRYKLILPLLTIFCWLVPGNGFGQETMSKLTTHNDGKKGSVKLSITQSGEVSLKGNDIKTDELANELSRRLKIPVILSPLMRGKNITADFARLPLEEAARQIAPHARVDYVLSRKNERTLLRPVAIYLSGYNEPEPSTEQSNGSESFAVVIEGDTDSATDTARGERLKINFEDNRLSVSARRQSLSLVVSEIAARAGLEFDLRYDSDEWVDIEIRDEPLAEALIRLSPHVRVYLRKDLLIGATTAFRIALAE